MPPTVRCLALVAFVGAACLGPAPFDSGRPAAGSADRARPSVVMETTLGTVAFELFEAEAPVSVTNFLSHVDRGFYDGTLFHRVIPDFMIQGGGLTPDLAPKPTGTPILNEAGNRLSNRRGTLAYARTSVVDSATVQFFVNVVDNPFLDHRDETPGGFGYAVFGRVSSGLDVIDAIAAVQTGARGELDDVPVTDVVITSLRRKAP